MDISIKGHNGANAVYAAVQEGKTDCLRTLLELKGDLAQAVDKGGFPLFVAAQRNHADCIRVLLEFKADPEQANPDGQTSVYQAAGAGQIAALRVLLKVANPTALEGDGNTSAHIATAQGHADCLRLLIDNGASVNHVNKEGDSPLELAMALNKKTCGELLMSAGAQLPKGFVKT